MQFQIGGTTALWIYNLFNIFFPQAVKGKYSSSKQMRVASMPQLRSSLLKDLAKLAH